jgi:hypothetical protein
MKDKFVVKYLYCRCGAPLDGEGETVSYPSGEPCFWLWCDACGYEVNGHDAEMLVKAFQEDLL